TPVAAGSLLRCEEGCCRRRTSRSQIDLIVDGILDSLFSNAVPARDSVARLSRKPHLVEDICRNARGVIDGLAESSLRIQHNLARSQRPEITRQVLLVFNLLEEGLGGLGDNELVATEFLVYAVRTGARNFIVYPGSVRPQLTDGIWMVRPVLVGQSVRG